MEFVTIEEQEFETFARTQVGKSYLQSGKTKRLREKNGWEGIFLGVKENAKIVAATLLLSKKRHLKKEFYTMRGPLLDYSNKELLTFFLKNLKEYAKKNNGYILRIDPYIEAISLDKDGKPTGEFDNQFIKENLKELGFKEVVAKEMLDTAQAKFMYVIDLKDTLEEVMKDMESKTRQMIRKNEKNGVVIRVGTKEDLPLFADIMQKTGERRNFQDRGLSYYENMYTCFGNELSLVFAELDILVARKNILEERKQIEKNEQDRMEKRKQGMCNEKKAQQKEIEEQKTKERLEKKEQELDILEKKYGTRIPLGGILYILYEEELASLLGGCYQEFMEYQPFYTIHYEMIKYGVEHGYKRYNFYAINNHLDKDDEQYGIYQFKRSFGGHVVEYLGEFILPIDKKIYLLEQTYHKIKK